MAGCLAWGWGWGAFRGRCVHAIALWPVWESGGSQTPARPFASLASGACPRVWASVAKLSGRERSQTQPSRPPQPQHLGDSQLSPSLARPSTNCFISNEAAGAGRREGGWEVCTCLSFWEPRPLIWIQWLRCSLCGISRSLGQAAPRCHFSTGRRCPGTPRHGTQHARPSFFGHSLIPHLYAEAGTAPHRNVDFHESRQHPFSCLSEGEGRLTGPQSTVPTGPSPTPHLRSVRSLSLPGTCVPSDGAPSGRPRMRPRTHPRVHGCLHGRFLPQSREAM